MALIRPFRPVIATFYPHPVISTYVKVHQSQQSEEPPEEGAHAAEATPREATRISSLGASLRSCVRQIRGARMVEPAALETIEQRALDVVTDAASSMSTPLSGRLSFIGGASLRQIALLRDVNLRRDAGDPSVEQSRELRRAGQELRRSFNRMSFESKNELSTEALRGLFDRFEERLNGTSSTKRELAPLTRALTEAARVVGLHGRCIPWGDGREAVTRVLGAVRAVTANRLANLDILSPSPEARDPSLPSNCATAARRSLNGTKLGIVQAFESAYAEFERAPSSNALRTIASVLEAWRRGEQGAAGIASGTNSEPLSRELSQAAHLSLQSTLREISLPLVRWGSAHYAHLPTTSINHLNEFLSGIVTMMRHAAISEVVRSVDGVSFERKASTTPSPRHPKTETLTPIDLKLSRHLGALSILGPTINDVVEHFLLEPGSVTARELAYVERASQWATDLEKRQVTTHEGLALNALLISEFDGGQGSIIPKELGHHFTTLQEKLHVSADSTKSGFVHPENVDWLREHIHEHDGFLLVIQEGSLHGSLSALTPAALFVATCDQAAPSPLMRKIEKNAASFIAELPHSSTGPHPRMVCELALSSPEASLFVRKYGEHAYGLLHKQFLFNTISRFPTDERVECFATCREGSTAMNAHERMGWRKTGCTYVDEHGTAFDILHNVVFPAATVRGERDIS